MSTSTRYNISHYTHDVFAYADYPYCLTLHPVAKTNGQHPGYLYIKKVLADMEEWLTISLGENNFLFSDAKIISPVTIYDRNNRATEEVPRFLFFKHESDLLAFKLRFGI